MTTDDRALLPGPVSQSPEHGVPQSVAAKSPWLARHFALRHLWLVPGIAIAVFANAQAGQHGLGLVPLLVFGIVPHLPVLLAIGQPHARGQMPSRAVPLFNAMHHPAPPLAILGLAVTGVLSPFWLVAALAWLGHILVDLAFGHGLRTSDGWRRQWWTSR